MNEREQILAVIREIPALPAQAIKVLQLAQNPEIGVSELMAAVEFDPALTSNILRLVNSAFFAGPRKIGSLVEAGVLLGMRRVAQVVVSAAIMPYANRPVKGYDLPAGAMYEQMAAAAIGAELLARELSIPAPPYTFTAGLLHSIGKIVLGNFAEVDMERIRKIAFDEALSFELAEERVLGINHAEAGALLLKLWNLPEEIVAAARWHRHPDGYPGEKLLIDLVHVADNLTKECGIGIGLDGLHYTRSAGAVERLRLTPVLMERVCCLLIANIEDLKARQHSS